jgi:hypothetical protein
MIVPRESIKPTSQIHNARPNRVGHHRDRLPVDLRELCVMAAEDDLFSPGIRLGKGG